MLSAFSKIHLASSDLFLKPIILNNLHINELTKEEFNFYFDENASELEGNSYYTFALLKIPSSIQTAFESNLNYVFRFYFSFEGGLDDSSREPFWLKCRLVTDDDDCSEGELSISRLALHNLKLSKNSSVFCRISEFPFYLNCKRIESKIFPKVHRIILQPITPLPDCVTNDDLDKAIKAILKSFKCPLHVNHQIIVDLRCTEDAYFSALFIISKIEPNVIGQFIFNEEIEIFLKMQYLYEPIPTRLQQSLSKSLLLPRPFLFKSFPENTADLEEFLLNDNYGKYTLSTVLIYGPCGSGKRTLIRRLVDDFGIPVCFLNLYKEERDEVFEKNEKFIEMLQKAFKNCNTVILEGFELLDNALKLQMAWSQVSQSANRKLRLICCFNSSKQPNDFILESFDLVKLLKMPGMAAIRSLTQELFEVIPQAVDLVTEEDFIGYSLYDYATLVERYLNNNDSETIIVDFKKIFEEFKAELKLRRSLQMNTIEIPKVTWDQVAGLEEVKEILKDLIGKLQNELRPTGVLLYGPPGTGKTLVAKALATQSRFSLLPVKGPELLSPYIGESESALREVFSEAAVMSPCIIFFDELDALVPKRGEFGDSVGVTDRMVATFMTEMDKISLSFEDSCVFVIGATNRPDLIDPVLLRKGRFDTCVLLDGPKSIEERADILKASCKGLRCSQEIDFTTPFIQPGQEAILNQLSPAQIASIATNAARIVLERKLELAAAHLNENFLELDLLIDPISTNDLIESCRQLFLFRK